MSFPSETTQVKLYLGDDELFDMDGFRALAPAEREKLHTEFIEAHVTMCGRVS